MKLKGVRTTAVYTLLLLLTTGALLLSKIDGGQFVSLVQVTFGLYVTAKVGYKGVEMMEKKKNGTN